MTALWIFGDSFAHYTPHDIWIQQLRDLTDTKPQYFGEGGTSMEYTYEKFNQQRNNIQDEDIIIIALTDINRRWFLRDNLKDTIWMIMSQDTEESKAVEAYLKCLNNPIHEVYLTNFMHNLEYLTKQKRTRTIILPCFDSTLNWLLSNKLQFPSITVADRSLLSISENEFKDPQLLPLYTQVVQGDLRRCHFIKSNHTILAEKLADTINNKKPLTLSQGFVEGVLTKDTLKDTDFSHKELFDVHIIPEREYWDRCVSLL